MKQYKINVQMNAYMTIEAEDYDQAEQTAEEIEHGLLRSDPKQTERIWKYVNDVQVEIIA